MANKPTIVGSTSVAATSVTIPAHQIGDLIVIYAFRDGVATAPSVPSAGGTVPAWNTLGTGAANTCADISAWFVATATTTTSGTWTNATGVGVIVFRGQNTDTPIGRVAVGGASVANTVAIPGLTGIMYDGNSQYVSFMGHRTVTAWSTATAGYTRQSSVATEISIQTKDTSTSSAGYSQACTATASGNRAQQFEVLAPPDTSTGKYRRQTAGSGHTGSGGFGAQAATFAKAVLSGSLLVCCWVGNSNLGNATCADNVNGAWNALTQQAPFSGSGRRHNVFWKENSAAASAGSLVVTVTPVADAGNSESMQIMEYVGWGAVDTAVTAYAVHASGTAVTQASGTPTQTNDLMLLTYSSDGENQTFNAVSPMTGAVLDVNKQSGGKGDGAMPLGVVELLGASTIAVTTAMGLSVGDDGGKYVIGFAPYSPSATPSNAFMPFMGSI